MGIFLVLSVQTNLTDDVSSDFYLKSLQERRFTKLFTTTLKSCLFDLFKKLLNLFV